MRPDFLGSLAGAPFRAWFRGPLARRARRAMAIEMLWEGDNGNWLPSASLRAQVLER